MAFVIHDEPQAAQPASGRFVVHDEPQTGYDVIRSGLKNVAAGAIKGAANIGSTLLRPVDATLNATGLTDMTNAERRSKIGDFFQENANPESLAFKGGELGSEIAGTAGVGGGIVKGLQVAKYAPKLAAAVESGGFKLGGAPAVTTGERIANAALRTAGGAVTGGASAGLVNPSDAGAGAVIGGALPGAVKLSGMAGKALVSEPSAEVAKLYKRAKELGIDLPADRLVNSKPLNAAAASLNYVPFSGRAATEERMASQFNRAISRTFGQDTPNLAHALKKAEQSLGDKFEFTLKSNNVKADEQFMNDIAANLHKAQTELSPVDAKVISNQIEEIRNAAFAGEGEIGGQTAYNIKKTLDRIGSRNSNDAFYARELRSSLMDALNRSLGPKEAQQFADLRRAYGNMLEVDKMVKHGAEAGIPPALIANKTTLRSPELNELADIAAQFLKTRENPHGAAQRVMIGTLATGVLPPVALARTANTVLNSEAAKNVLLNQAAIAKKAQQIAENKPLRALVYSGARSNP